jgi:hypothetical protein
MLYIVFHGKLHSGAAKGVGIGPFVFIPFDPICALSAEDHRLSHRPNLAFFAIISPLITKSPETHMIRIDHSR